MMTMQENDTYRSTPFMRGTESESEFQMNDYNWLNIFEVQFIGSNQDLSEYNILQ